MPAEKPVATSPTNNNHKVSNGKGSERGLLSLVTLIISLGTLTVSLVGGARLIFDIFGTGLVDNLDTISTKSIVLGLAYLFGLGVAVLCIRVYKNIVLAYLLNLYAWACLFAICGLYAVILQRLYGQGYDWLHYWAYLLTIFACLFALIGLHLIIDDHNLRPFSIPLLAVNFVQLTMIVIRYIFTDNAKSEYLGRDLFFFATMVMIGGLMLAHLGILTPFRNKLTALLDKSSDAIKADS